MSTLETGHKSETEWLAQLSSYVGEPDTDQYIGLEDAARLLADSTLTWSQVETAMNEGWEPGSETILEYLYGADQVSETSRW